MEVKTQVRDLRVTYEGLGGILRYLEKPEYRGARITKTDHRFEDGKHYFHVDLEFPVPGTDDSIRKICAIELIGDPRCQMNIDQLDLSVRAYNCLDAAKIITLGELVSMTEADLLKVRSFGRTSLREIKRKLADMGLSLGMSIYNLPDHTTGSFPRIMGLPENQ